MRGLWGVTRHRGHKSRNDRRSQTGADMVPFQKSCGSIIRLGETQTGTPADVLPGHGHHSYTTVQRFGVA